MKQIFFILLIGFTANLVFAQDTIYGNGKKEQISATENQDSEIVSTVEESQKTYKGEYFMLGIGIGSSYGYSGARVQWRFGGIMGYGFHAGVGYDPGAPIAGSAGVKFFPYKGLYINAQFGTKWIKETMKIFAGYGGTYPAYYPIYEVYDISYIGYGPSLLIGGDWVWGRGVAYGLNFGLGVSYIINSKSSDKILPAMDLGFLVRF